MKDQSHPGLYEENQILSEKYESLCADYYELVKKQKLSEYSLSQVKQNNSSQITQGGKSQTRGLKLKIKEL
jgi:hypothetical protein